MRKILFTLDTHSIRYIFTLTSLHLSTYLKKIRNELKIINYAYITKFIYIINTNNNDDRP